MKINILLVSVCMTVFVTVMTTVIYIMFQVIKGKLLNQSFWNFTDMCSQMGYMSVYFLVTVTLTVTVTVTVTSTLTNAPDLSNLGAQPSEIFFGCRGSCTNYFPAIKTWANLHSFMKKIHENIHEFLTIFFVFLHSLLKKNLCVGGHVGTIIQQ